MHFSDCEISLDEDKKCCEKRHCHCAKEKKLSLKDLKSPSMEYALELSKQILKKSPLSSSDSSSCNSQKEKSALPGHKSPDPEDEKCQNTEELKVPEISTKRRHSFNSAEQLLPEIRREGLKRSKSTCEINIEEDEEKGKMFR